MWTTTSVALAGASILGFFVVSLVVAKRDTVDELRILYDLRVIRRAARSLGRFSLGTLMWLTAYIAVMIPIIQSMGNSPVILVLVPLVTVTFLLTRVAMKSILEPCPRRIQPRRRFPSPASPSRANELSF